ncbi:hypothetical protein LDO26_17110, partial [Luteimonas sp. BDR2-5]|uniref:hypothetical protein n=1 Tax=Proluteimonas luteida TaxID=2878685 RepID=UPI001E305007
ALAMDLQPRAPEHGARRHHAHAEARIGRLAPLLAIAKNGGITLAAVVLEEHRQRQARLELHTIHGHHPISKGQWRHPRPQASQGLRLR